MNSLRYLSGSLALAGMMMLAACGQKEEKKADTDSVVKVVTEEEELEEFSSPDLGLWNLTGPVSGAVFYSYEVKDSTAQPDPMLTIGMDSVTYNRQGLITSMVSGSILKGKTEIASDLRFNYDEDGRFTSGTEATSGSAHKVKLSRTSGGYLQVLQVLGPDGELSTSDSYYRLTEWVAGTMYSTQIEDSEGTIRSTYTNNADGMPEKVVTKISDMGGETRIEEDYRYTEFDKYGNWIERRVIERTTITEGEADGTNQKTTNHLLYRLDRRNIYYYPPKEPTDSK